MSLEELEDSGEECLGISWVLVEFTSESIEEEVLVYSGTLEISYERLQLSLEGGQLAYGAGTSCFSLLVEFCNCLILFKYFITLLIHRLEEILLSVYVMK